MIADLYKEFNETGTLSKDSINSLFIELAKRDSPKEILVKDNRADRLLDWLNRNNNSGLINNGKCTGLLSVYSSYLIKICRCFLEESKWNKEDDDYIFKELKKWRQVK